MSQVLNLTYLTPFLPNNSEWVASPGPGNFQPKRSRAGWSQEILNTMFMDGFRPNLLCMSGNDSGSEKCMIIDIQIYTNRFIFTDTKHMIFPAPRQVLAPNFIELACSANTAVGSWDSLLVRVPDS